MSIDIHGVIPPSIIVIREPKSYYNITSKLKILRIKKREYRDGIKSKETRPGWGGGSQSMQSMCSYIGITKGF